jgi:hypothetical protein
MSLDHNRLSLKRAMCLVLRAHPRSHGDGSKVATLVAGGG